MTKADKPTIRETYSSVRERGKLRPLVIEVHPTFVRVRLKGTRRAYTVTMDQIWTVGAKTAAETARHERAVRKAERKKARAGK